jgi:transcription initiation factor TFIIIB Brf1 subunit/transcription initiation factor TFIIB
MSTLQQQAEALLVRAHLSPPPAPKQADEPKYRRLTLDQIKAIRDLRKLDKTQTEIAQVLGVDQKTVSRHLQALIDDSTSLATDAAKASAYRRVRRLDSWTRKRDKVGLEAARELNRIAGLTDKAGIQANVGVQVLIGMPGQPAGSDPLQVVEAQVVTGKDAR